MSIVTQSESYLNRNALRCRLALWCAVAAYTALLAFNIAHHEPWVDEAQSWLLARDSNLLELWTKLLRYEGSPGLWHTLLYFCIRLGVPYAGINIISGVAGLAAIWILLRYAPFPLPIRLLLPFTFFLSYQYAVIARNYALVPILLFSCATVYKEGIRRGRLITVLLCFLAAVNAQAFILSLSIWFVFHARIAAHWHALDRLAKTKVITNGIVYFTVLLILVLLTWPTRDITFARVPDWSIQNFLTVTKFGFRQAFGEGILPLVVIALTVPFLWRGGGWLLFLLPSFLLCVFGAVMYSFYWHWGFLFFAWLFGVWISSTNIKPTLPVLVALLTVIVVQCYWTFASTRYDWKNAYSGSLAAASYIKKAGLTGKRLYAIGVSCVGVQPYFPKNIFANFNSGQNRAFWDWSRRNHTNDSVEHLGSSSPDYVLVGYLSPPEKLLWTRLVAGSGYKLVKHFEGQTFWRTGTIQPDSFDLYQRGSQTRDNSLSSTVSVAEPKVTSQLLWGFHELSDNSWRWTTRKFTVALQRPVGSEQSGAQIHLRFFVPDHEIKALGPIKLTAQIVAYRLRSMRIRQGGSYEYIVDVPTGALFADILSVDFSLNKAMPPSERDARELGVVVSAIQIVRPT
ncbi:MAG: hypothetical protein ACJ73N_04550 [Bryobacteraceae bacterium]